MLVKPEDIFHRWRAAQQSWPDL